MEAAEDRNLLLTKIILKGNLGRRRRVKESYEKNITTYILQEHIYDIDPNPNSEKQSLGSVYITSILQRIHIL